MTDDDQVVRGLLATAGFQPPTEEIARIVDAYPMIRGMVDSLYAVEAARYESPALIFEPEPTFADWA
jgi:hypothetical protein